MQATGNIQTKASNHLISPFKNQFDIQAWLPLAHIHKLIKQLALRPPKGLS